VLRLPIALPPAWAFALASALAIGRAAMPHAGLRIGANVGQLLLARFLRALLPLAFLCPH